MYVPNIYLPGLTLAFYFETAIVIVQLLSHV